MGAIDSDNATLFNLSQGTIRKVTLEVCELYMSQALGNIWFIIMFTSAPNVPSRIPQ